VRLTQNWTVKLEYNFLRYGAKAFGFVECSNSGNGPPCINGTESFQADQHIVKVGVNYLFNWGGAPLVARY
jgi:opacity protein-like surface antigen